MMNNNNRSWARRRAQELFGELATERAQAEEMEIKEMDPNGDMVIATEEGVTTSRITPEDSLYSADSPERIQMRETTKRLKKMAESEEDWNEFAQTYWNDKESEEDEESGVNYLLDPLFDGFKGIIQTFTGMNSGAVMRNQQTIDELNFMEKALQIEEQFKAIDKQLDAAYLAEDVELIRKLYPHKATLAESYYEVLPDLNRAKRKYWEEVTNREDKYQAIEDYRNELLESNATDAEDMERWNNFQNTINQNVYNVSQEWDRRKEGDWGVLYQLPNALGTSASSLLVSIGTGLGAAAANAAASSPALSSGPAGAAVVGGAAVIGLTTSIAGTLWAINQESLSELSNNYTAAIQEYAQKHGIDTSEIIAEGRRKLHELTGSYSDDPNDPEYRDDSQVLTGMLTYGIELGDLQLEKASKISRRRLEDVYTRNMMLATSDVAQNFVMIPGVGKFLNKAFKGADDIVADAATKTIDDIMRYTSAKVARSSAESVAKRTSKYIVDPIVRVGYTGLSEGFEELSQYMYGKQMDPDAKQATDNSGNINFYSPFDILSTSAENFGMLVKGIEGLMGISSDKSLNNDKELATNFKVGALVGALMGGVSTFGKARKEFNSYNKGRALAREMVREHVNAREAMFRYNQYAKKAIGGALDWNAFSSGFDNAINSENLPDTWTAEELEKEKAAAKNIFAMASTKPIKAISKKHRAAALAYLQYQQDRFEETKNISVTENAEFINKLNKAVKDYCDLHGIDDIYVPLLAEYFRLKEGRDALKRYEESWLMLKGQKDYFVDPKKADNKLIELAETRNAMEQELSIIEQQLRNSNLTDKIENYNTLPSVNDDIASNAIENVLKTIALKDIQDDVRNVLNDPKALERAAIRYKQSIADNEQLEEEVRRFEDENLDAAIQEQENEEEKIIEEVEGTGLSTEEDPFVVIPTEADGETSYTPLSEEQGEISTEDNPVIIGTYTPEESATQSSELSAASLLEEAEQSYYSQFEEEDIEDYDQTDYSEELSEESLDNDPAAISEQFEEQIIEENKRNRDEIKRLSDENEQMRQTIAQFEERFNDLERRLQAAEQDVPRRIVEHPEQPSKPVTEEDAQFEENIPEDQHIIEQPTGTVEIFYSPTNTRPMMSGYESGASLNEYFSTPGTIESSSYSAWVGDKNSPYGMYDPNDRSTWDNAAVYVEITGANGKKYITALKTIQGAKELAFKLGKEFTSEQEEELRNLRNTIIAAKIADPNAEITFGEVRMSAGKLNNQRDSEGRAVQRKLTDIKGLNLPKDLHQLFDTSHGIRFGIGKGSVGGYVIVDQRDMPLPGIGRSGKIYIYPAASSTMDGVSRPIQLTEKKFTHTTGDTNSFAYQIANALLYGHADIDGIPVNDLLNVMLNYGEGTLLEQDDARRSFMENKQFYIDYKKGIVTLGKNTYSIDDVRSNNGVERIAQFIADELHWNTEKTILWNSLPSSFGQYLNRTGKNKASLFNGELEFDREDLELSGMAFMVKHGYLTSDLADQIYETPFVYVGKPTIKTTAEPEPEPIGTDSSAMDALLERESEEKDKYESEDDPYTNPDSAELTDFFGDLNAAPKTIPTHQVGKATKKINEKRARKWLADKLNLSENDVEVVDGVIRTLSNGKSVIGVAKADGIKLSSSAEYGVEYHEAWHRVSLLMLTPEQRRRLYKEFRKTNPKYKHASDKVVEEAMADQFMDYMVADDKEGFKYLITKYYRKFKHFIRINSNIDHYSLQEMFKAVKYGEMAKYKLDEESLKEFRKAYKHGAAYTIGPNKNVNLASITSPYEYQQLLNSIKSILIASNKLKYISDIQQLDSNKAKEFIQKRMQSPRITTEQREVLREVVDNFDVIMKDLQPIMEKMGIREIDAEHDSDFANRETTGIQNYDKAAYEFNKKDNALGSAKMFLSTIVDTRYSFKDGIKSEPIPVISKLTGLPLIVDYDVAYAKVLHHLSDVETFAPTKIDEDANLSLIGKCRQLGETDPFFAILYKRLLRVDMNTETQLLQTIKSFNQNFQEINYQTGKDGKTSFVLSDSIMRRAVINKPKQWSENFFNSRFVNHDGGVSKLDVAALNNVKQRYNELVQDVINNEKTLNEESLKNYLNTLIVLFNELGITVDKETFDSYLGKNRIKAFPYILNNRSAGSMYNFFNNQLDAIIQNKPIKDKSGTRQVRQLNEVFIPRGQSVIGLLAEHQVKSNSLENEIAILGPNNNVIFTKTLNCFVSDQIRWLNNHDKLVMADFENDPYCASSLIYNTVKNNRKIKLNTFVNFYGLNQNDKGRDYVSISPVEDYIAKMVFTWNNHIIFPTMADKKTWFTISGCKLFNDPFKISRNSQGRLKLEYSVNALDHVYNEWLDEYNTIVEYYNTLSDVTHPIKNYHTSGKGGLFRHHTGYFTVIDGQLKWVDLNARLKNSKDIKKTLEEIKNELFTGDKNATYQKINDNLARERKAEIDECIRLGIIEKKADGTLTNKLLDSKVLEHFIDKYKKHEDAAVNTFAEHYAIVTMIGNHMLNTNISVEETEKIFTGDPAFFKNNEDKIKRLGAVLSTGDNLRTQWMQATTSTDAAVTAEYTRLQNRQTYTSTVINDNMVQSQQYDLLKQMFTQYYVRQLLIEQGLTEAQIDKLSDEEIKKEHGDVYAMAKTLGEDDASAYGLYKGKGAINQADAAVYVSPAMYRDIVKMLGEWNDEIAEAYDIMESGLEWLNDSAKCAKAMKALIKPLKTTYFCNQYNPNIKHTVPVFDKMAMFPLFRVIATGDNKELYDRMNAIGKYAGQEKIDQIAFESAKKVGIIGASDVYTDYTNESMNNLSKMHVVTQRFRNLRRQLITDPHAHDRTLFGTQVSTVAVSNLVLDRVYQQGTPNEKTGAQIMEDLFGTINAISNKGIVEVTNIYLNDKGEVDLEKTSKTLIKKAHSQNMGKDVEDALQLNETKDDFKIPLSALPDSKWVETALISDVNKKAVDLELPGGAFIQMSSFGVKSIRVAKGLDTDFSQYTVNNGKRLVNMNEDGSMDAVISINLLKHIIPGYDKMSFMQARQWLIDNKIIGENAEPAALGYRIPTQGLSSIAGIRISDVLPPVVGDTIILPDEFTAQTGSDFDIDKLYIARYNYEQVWMEDETEFEEWFKSQVIIMAPDERGVKQMAGRFENRKAAKQAFVNEHKGYRLVGDVDTKTDVIQRKKVRIVPFDHSKGYEGNSKEANENLLLRTYLDVLTDKKNVGETRLPLDKTTGIIKDEILPIVDGPAKNQELIPYKELSPTYQMGKKYEYNGGKAGIGPFALNNKNHILTQLTNLVFAPNPLLELLGFTGLNGINSRDEMVIERDDKGRKIKNEDGTYKYKLDKGVRILDWLSAMINAHVDVAKDPYVIRLNVCQYTYNLCNFLLRVGYGKSTFYFLPQPIFKEMSAAYDNASGNYGVDATKSKTKVVQESIQAIRKRYAAEFSAAANRLGKTDIQVTIGNEGVQFNRSVVTRDENGKDKVINTRMSWQDHAKNLMDRDFLIDQLQLSQKEKMTDQEAYDYYLNQLRLSELFEYLNSRAEDMSKLVQLSQIDTKKYGNNFVEQDRFIYRLKALYQNTTLFDPDRMMDYYRDTFLYTKLINGIVTPQAIFEDTMLRSKRPFLDNITKVLMLTIGLEHNDEALNKIISNELEATIRNKFLNGKINLKGLFYGDNTMAKRLNNLKFDIISGKYPEYRTQDGKITNGLLNHLDVLSKMTSDKYEAPQIITRRAVAENDKNLNSILKEYWSELLNSPHEEIRKFAEDLALYMLATTGGNHTKNGIFNLIPIEYIISSGYGEFMRSMTSQFISSDINFDEFFLNNWHNDKLIKPIKLTKTVVDEFGPRSDDRFPIVRFINKNGASIPVVLNPTMYSKNQNSSKQPVFQPFVKVRLEYDNNPANTLVYKYVGYNVAKMTPVYVLVNKLGLNQNGRVIKEYHRGITSESEFDFNNHLFANINLLSDLSSHQMTEFDRTKLNEIVDDFIPVDDYIPELYNYLLHKMKELDAYVNGREFNETYEEKAPVKISSIATKDEFAQTAIKTEEQMTAQEKKRAVDLAKNELDFAEGVIEKIDYSAKFRSMSEENKKQRYEMTLRVNKYNALLEGLKTGDSTYIVNEYGVPQVVFINKDIQNTTGDATDIKNLAKQVSSNGITAQYGVEIKPKEWVKANHSQWQQSNPNGIVAYRINFKQFNTVAEANDGRIGNPFSIDQRGADTVEQFFEWLVTGNNFGVAEANEQYRQAIVNKILNTPEDSKILYYTELNRPSHATVIGYLINNKQLLTGNNVSNQFIKSAVQLDLFKDKSTINVYSRDDNGYKELSNFSERPFIMSQKNGTTVSFRSVEQAFQFTKVQYYANNPSVATNIMFSNNPAEIKRFGTTTPMTSEQIAKWDKVSTSLMYRLMLQSFMQNESAKQLLLSTGDAILTHKNERGVEQDKGRFSKLLMQIRDEIRQSEQESNFYNGMSQNDINSIEEQKKRQDEQCK